MKNNTYKTMKNSVLGMAMMFALAASGYAQTLVNKPQAVSNFNITVEMVLNAQEE